MTDNLALLLKGFLPSEICRKSDSSFDDVEDLLSNLPKLLATSNLGNQLKHLKIYDISDDLTNPELERLMLLYSYLGHAYMWGGPETPLSIPENISIPWVSIAKKLNRPPILSYASYALNNWETTSDDSSNLAVEDISILQNFLGGIDEDWFIMIHIAIEYEAKFLLGSLYEFFVNDCEDENYLGNAMDSIKNINLIMNRMPEHCDPYIYYNRVRPYIFGWKNNPATPNGVIYEGVQEYSNKPQFFRGETGAQSSIIPAVDALLGIEHSSDPLRVYLDEMREYMPVDHRDLLKDLDVWKDQYSKSKRKELASNHKEIINEIVIETRNFRHKHLDFARDYIHNQSQNADVNSNAVGTGGTPFMKYLEKHLTETEYND